MRVLFSSLTGDFDASELGDGEQIQVCSRRLSLSAFCVYDVVFKKLEVLELRRHVFEVGLLENMF